MAELIGNGEEFLRGTDMAFSGGVLSKGSGEADRRRHGRVSEKWKNLTKMGWESVTVFNCMPFPLELNGQIGYFNIRACQISKGELFFAYTIDKPRMPCSDEGDGKMVPEPCLPIEIAMNFMESNAEFGGVFYMKGTAESLKGSPEVMQRVDDARQKMRGWAEYQYNLGEEMWVKFNRNPGKIPPYSRVAADFLKQEGIIDGLPEWCKLLKATAGNKNCEHCAESIKTEAKVCRWCSLRQGVSLDDQQMPARSRPQPESEPKPITGGIALDKEPPARESDEEADQEDLDALRGPAEPAGPAQTGSKKPEDKNRKGK